MYGKQEEAMAECLLCRQLSEVRAQCLNWARWDPCGGCLVTGIPTAIGQSISCPPCPSSAKNEDFTAHCRPKYSPRSRRQNSCHFKRFEFLDHTGCGDRRRLSLGQRWLQVRWLAHTGGERVVESWRRVTAMMKM